MIIIWEQTTTVESVNFNKLFSLGQQHQWSQIFLNIVFVHFSNWNPVKSIHSTDLSNFKQQQKNGQFFKSKKYHYWPNLDYVVVVFFL